MVKIRRKWGKRCLLAFILILPLWLSFRVLLLSTHEQVTTQYVTLPLPKNHLASLQDLAGSSTTSCPNGLHYVTHQANRTLRHTRIPPILHQTSKTRCVTADLLELANEWKAHSIEYYLHDDAAIRRLISTSTATFPGLTQAFDCITTGAGMADVWRYLILWEYGGIYADIETQPTIHVNTSLILQEDAFFVVDKDYMLSQYFMAVSPGHPLLYLTIQLCLSNLLLLQDTMANNPVKVTGPAVLRQAIVMFCTQGGYPSPYDNESLQLQAGHYRGVGQRSVTVQGTAQDSDHLVIREGTGLRKKLMLYQLMNMTHFTEQRSLSHISCARHIWDRRDKWLR